ncbi:MAG: methyltransferase domain-containing protein [Polyangiaceae bacterium]|jgi:SAM-dependent methyltransferase
MTDPVIVPCDFDTITREETPQAIRVAEYLRYQHPNSRILDVGCGPGIYVQAMRQLGLDAYGIDSDARLPKSPEFLQADITNFMRFSLKEPFSTEFQVVLSLEVGEHMPEDYADDYILSIQFSAAKIVYFSAARPGQGGHGHINCQPKAYWVKKFHHRGYWLDPDATSDFMKFMGEGYHMGWLTQNGMVFRQYQANS